MKNVITTGFAALLSLLALVFAPLAHAALYTTNFGTNLLDVSDCDDCASSPVSLGAGQTIDFFGTVYNSLYVTSNGYVIFGNPIAPFFPEPPDTQTVGPLIGGFITDLDPSNDPASNVYVNASTAGQLIITYDNIAHSQDPTARSTFQLLIRSDQASIPAGEGQFGFFYGTITDNAVISAGIGDGDSEVHPGEVAFASTINGTDLSNHAPYFFTLNGGQGQPPGDVPEPAGAMLLLAGLCAYFASQRRKRM